MTAQILLTGGYGRGNFGDDALLLACHQALSAVAAPKDVWINGLDAPYVRQMAPGMNIVSPEHDIRFDIEVFGGGTQFYSFAPDNPQPVLTRLMAVPRRMARLVLPRRRGASIVRAGLGVGFGPFLYKAWGWRRARQVARQCRFLAVRDTRSQAFCQQLGAPCLLRTDLCFASGLWPTAPKTTDGLHKILVIVRDWPHEPRGRAHETPLLKAVADIRRLGLTVQYMLFKRGDNEWHERLKQRGEEVLIWDPDQMRLDGFLQQIQRFDAVVTSRYHGAVFGALLGLPVICIGIEPKLELCAEAMSQRRWLWAYPFPAADLVEQMQDLATQYGIVVERQNQYVDEQRALADTMVAEFRSFLETQLK